MRVTRNLLFTSLLMMVAQVIFAQATYVLKGQVIDQDNNPIEYALLKNAENEKERGISDPNGLFQLETLKPVKNLLVIRDGFAVKTVAVGSQTFVQIVLVNEVALDTSKVIELKDELYDLVQEDVETEVYYNAKVKENIRFKSLAPQSEVSYNYSAPGLTHQWNAPAPMSNESYSKVAENDFKFPKKDPLSTFSIDVDRASYSNVRRFLNMGQLPPVDAVRVEEMVNYFPYEYGSPKGKDPLVIYTEVGSAPWNQDHQLVQIGIKARDIEKAKLPASNLVFLIDVSGSMNASNKLPLLKSSMKMLVNELRSEDRVAIVVYAGAAGLVLESTSGEEKEKIYEAIERLNAGGSTAGGAGINLAYATAKKYFQKEGNNRVILATDGDFNVGASSDQAMEQLIEAKRKEGVFLTVLGFGMGNYKDSKMEILADKGNGNYAYIDNLSEARKTLISEFGSTLFTVAKDVKIQVEFNPQHVQAYRLIGYENRLLAAEDFNDDKKDAGEIGAGHVVTALYEVVPNGVEFRKRVDDLKYAEKQDVLLIDKSPYSGELMTVKLRYKDPDGEKSQLMSKVVNTGEEKSLDKCSDNLKWSASMASFGLILRNSEHTEDLKMKDVIAVASTAVGEDKDGYRREALQMMKNAEQLILSTASSN